MTIPKVSIVMTAYGVAPWIKQAVDSVLASTETDIELIVVDDASDDGTAEILAEFSDPRMRVIRNAENVGAGVSRQVGIGAARGVFVMLIDGDDYIAEDFIEALVKRQEESGAAMVSGGITFVDDEKGVIGEYETKDEEWESYEDVTRLWGKRLLFLNNMLIKRDLLIKTGYSPRRYIEDAQTRFMLMYYADRIAYSSNKGYFYRRRASSLTNSASGLKDAIYRALAAMDLMLFFRDKGEKWNDLFGIKLFASGINNLKQYKPTRESVEPWREDFMELMLYMMNI